MPFPSGGIYCAGNICLDILVRPVESMPDWGTTTWVDSIAQYLGGNGAITAFALGKLGAPVRLAGAVGDDAFGDYAMARLASAGVDLSHIRVTPGVQTATTVGLINARSERLFLHVLGSSALVYARMPPAFVLVWLLGFYVALGLVEALWQFSRRRRHPRSSLPPQL